MSGDSWSADRHRRQVREHAVRDVLDDGMPVIGAAALWGVQADELQRLVDDAEGRDES